MPIFTVLFSFFHFQPSFCQTDSTHDFREGIAQMVCVKNGEIVPKPAQLVSFHDGVISLKTAGAPMLAVITDDSFHRKESLIQKKQRVRNKKNVVEHRIPAVLLGKTTVLVRGRVHFGDFLIPSGKDDGMALAISPRSWNTGNKDQPVLGIAWSSHPFEGIHLVEACIGPWNQEAILTFIKEFHSP
jgi:hypothetical protein